MAQMSDDLKLSEQVMSAPRVAIPAGANDVMDVVATNMENIDRLIDVVNFNADTLRSLCKKIEELEEMIDEPDWEYDETPKVSPSKTMVTDICGDVYPATYRDGIFYDLSNIAVRVIAWMPYPEPAKKRWL